MSGCHRLHRPVAGLVIVLLDRIVAGFFLIGLPAPDG